MDSSTTKSMSTQAHGFYAPNDEQIAQLQSILQSESQQQISAEAALEIGTQLVSLYECLARDRKTPLEVRENEQLR